MSIKMLKSLISAAAILTILLIVNIYSCGNSYAGTQNKNHNKIIHSKITRNNSTFSKNSHNKITIEDIHKELSKNETVILRKFKEKYVLAEVRNKLAFDKGADVDFILYNLQTGERNTVIDDSTRDIKLARIEDENNILVMASGDSKETKISYHSIHLFPYLIRCMRLKNPIKLNSDFVEKREPAFFLPYEDLKFGDESYSIISDFKILKNGLSIKFIPQKINSKLGYTEYMNIPITKPSYNWHTGESSIEFENTIISDKVLKYDLKKAVKNNLNISECKIKQNGTYALITFTGKKPGMYTYYSVDISRVINKWAKADIILKKDVDFIGEKSEPYLDTRYDRRLTAELPKQKIKLYGGKQIEGVFKQFYLNSGNREAEFNWDGAEDASWRPALELEDLDNDKKKEIVVSLNLGHGTGFFQDAMHIVKSNALKEIPIENPIHWLEKNVHASISKDKIKFSFKGGKITAKKSTFPSGYKYKPHEHITFGMSYIEHKIESNKITCLVSANIDWGVTASWFKLTYAYKNGSFKVSDVKGSVEFIEK